MKNIEPIPGKLYKTIRERPFVYLDETNINNWDWLPENSVLLCLEQIINKKSVFNKHYIYLYNKQKIILMWIATDFHISLMAIK